MEKLVKKVIEKIRQIYGNSKYADIVNESNPQVRVWYREATGKLELISIRFGGWDEIVCTSHRLVFTTEHGSEITLLEYNSFEDLIKI